MTVVYAALQCQPANPRSGSVFPKLCFSAACGGRVSRMLPSTDGSVFRGAEVVGLLCVAPLQGGGKAVAPLQAVVEQLLLPRRRSSIFAPLEGGGRTVAPFQGGGRA